MPKKKLIPKEEVFAVNIEAPQGDYRCSKIYNAFEVTTIDTFLIIRCILVSSHYGNVLDEYFFSISRMDLERSKVSMMPYLERIPEASDYNPIMVPARPTKTLPAVDSIMMINAGHSGQVGEIRLSNFSASYASILAQRESKSAKEDLETLKCDNIAILRADIKIHRELLVNLYSELEL